MILVWASPFKWNEYSNNDISYYPLFGYLAVQTAGRLALRVTSQPWWQFMTS